MTTTMPTNANSDARQALKTRVLQRKSSLTENECAFLHFLLVDPPPKSETDAVVDESDHTDQLERAAKVLDDDILFSVPAIGENENENAKETVPPKVTRSYTKQLGLWKAHEDGATKFLLNKDNQKRSIGAAKEVDTEEPAQAEDGDDKADDEADDENDEAGADSSVKSDEEVRHEKSDNDDSEASSWNLEDGGFEHYDAWEVLKDEYAEDFGFSYEENTSVEPDDDENPSGVFRILGTSADDASALPHVLSPPLMEALLSFVPESVAQENLWLKYSLVRDGASMATLKQYVRATNHTILAIETTNGDVFGSFTSSAWRTNLGYYGSGEAFLWKMRHNRMAPVHSLFEQAQLENEIDVYYYSNLNSYIQLCTKDKIAVGGGGLDTSGEEKHGDVNFSPFKKVQVGSGEEYGFGIALTEDLLGGTSSPCATFRSPCLVSNQSKGETFEIVNMEIWGFTPCYNVDAAEKNEMSKFFIQESIFSNRSDNSNFSSQDFNQEDFYRRLGERDESELERDRWQYAALTAGALGR